MSAASYRTVALAMRAPTCRAPTVPTCFPSRSLSARFHHAITTVPSRRALHYARNDPERKLARFAPARDHAAINLPPQRRTLASSTTSSSSSAGPAAAAGAAAAKKAPPKGAAMVGRIFGAFRFSANLGIVLLSLGVGGTLLWAVGTDLVGSDSPQRMFAHTADRLRNVDAVTAILGRDFVARIDRPSDDPAKWRGGQSLLASARDWTVNQWHAAERAFTDLTSDEPSTPAAEPAPTPDSESAHQWTWLWSRGRGHRHVPHAVVEEPNGMRRMTLRFWVEADDAVGEVHAVLRDARDGNGWTYVQCAVRCRRKDGSRTTVRVI